MSVWTTDKDRKAYHTVLWFPVWAISWVWTFHMGVFSPLPPPNMTFKHPEVIKHRVTVLTSLWGYESHELRANCCRSLFLLQWTLCWFTSHTKSSRQRQDSTLHAPCQAMQPLLLEGLLLSLTGAAERKARRPSLVQNKSGGNLIVSKEAGRQESSPHDHFLDFFLNRIVLLGPTSVRALQQVTPPSALLNHCFPNVSLFQLAMKHHQLPHKGSASDMHWRCLLPWSFLSFTTLDEYQNLQKGDIKGEREGLLTSRLTLTWGMWRAIS